LVYILLLLLFLFLSLFLLLLFLLLLSIFIHPPEAIFEDFSIGRIEDSKSLKISIEELPNVVLSIGISVHSHSIDYIIFVLVPMLLHIFISDTD
jgi:hypothetical protein